MHPGDFFDIPHEAYLVVSLLPPQDTFGDAFERNLEEADSLGSSRRVEGVSA